MKEIDEKCIEICYGNTMRRKIHKTINFIWVTAIAVAVTLPAFGNSLVAQATKKTPTVSELQDQIQNTQDTIDSLSDKIDVLEDQQSLIDEQIDDLHAEIVNTMTSIDMKEEEIAAKVDEISEKQTRLTETVAEIEIAEENYQEAKEREEQQYSDMLVRIRYMYEYGGNDCMGAILQGDGLSDILNRMDYLEKVYEYDRTKLDEFEATKEEVQQLWNTLLAEQAKLETEKKELETDKEALEAARESLESQKANLDGLLAQKKKESSNYDTEIAKAKQEAAAAKKLLQQEKQQLKKIQDDQKKPVNTPTNPKPGNNETDPKSGNNNSDPTPANTDPNGGSGQTGNESVPNNEEPDPAENPGQTGNDPAPADEEPAPASPDPAPTTEDPKPGNGGSSDSSINSIIDNAPGSDLGKKIAKYACQYIGNPYVFGGTSLTNGADCSGFTYRVYSDFGYSLPRTSLEQRSSGKAVDYSNAQPGDLICYDGHVALYIGGGKIVHASSVKTGIKISNATYRPILAVRRII